MGIEKKPRLIEIVPDQGALPIEFGMGKQQVRRALGIEPHWSTTDLMSRAKLEEHYDDFIGVHYDADEKVYSVVLASDHLRVMIRELELLGPNAVHDPIKALAMQDSLYFETVGFVVFDQLGIALTGCVGIEGDERTITVFKRGTWKSYGMQAK